MKEYFKSVGCEYVIVDVFAYNDIGKNFYNKKIIMQEWEQW